MNVKAISPVTTAAIATGLCANTIPGAPSVIPLSPRGGLDLSQFKSEQVITIPMNPLPVRVIFRRLELPFDRARLYENVADLVYRDPGATLLGPELQERLVSEVTDDMISVLQTAVATGADIAPYYSTDSEQFLPKAQRMIAQLIANKLAGKEGYSQGTAAEQKGAAALTPRRKVLRRVFDQLRTFAPEVFEGRTRSEVRSLISAVIVWEAPALPHQIFHGGRLTEAGIRYFKGIG